MKDKINKQIKLKTQGLEDNRLDQIQLQKEILKTEKHLDNMINKLGKLRQFENEYIYRIELLKLIK